MNKSKNYIAYYRVSTQRQGRSGLGLEAQQRAVSDYLADFQAQVIEEFTEVETGKGSSALNRRPVLREALKVFNELAGLGNQCHRQFFGE